MKPTLLTNSESPFGGVKSSIPDFCPGTVNVVSGDEVYLTDMSGTNSTKTLGAGKLKELGLLTIDTVAHTITEEFLLGNTATSNTPSVIDACINTTGWSIVDGTGTISIENGRLKITGTSSASGYFRIQKTNASDLSQFKFLCFSLQSTLAGNAHFTYYGVGYSGSIGWSGSAYSVPQNINKNFVLAISNNSGQSPLPNSVSSFTFSNAGIIKLGLINLTPNTSITMYVGAISKDNPVTAQIEIQTNNHLADTSAQIYTHNGTTSQLYRTCKLDSTYTDVSVADANFTLANGTKISDVYGSGLGRSIFPKGSAGETKQGSLEGSSIIFSNHPGADKRIGIQVDLPPSDGGRTNFNKCRIKLVIYYSGENQTSTHIGSTTYKFSDSNNESTGLQRLMKPWIALFDPSKNIIDVFRFTHIPKAIEYKKDGTGQIYEIIVSTVNGMLYHSQHIHYDMNKDSDSNYIPNFLEASIDGSITKLLQSYGW